MSLACMGSPNCGRHELVLPNPWYQTSACLFLTHRTGEFLKGEGCAGCGQIGYRGRVGLYEMWEVSPEVRKLVESNTSEAEIREASLENRTLSTLMEDAMAKAETGLTNLEELRRALPIEQIATHARSRG